jgi:hypothetical protein
MSSLAAHRNGMINCIATIGLKMLSTKAEYIMYAFAGNMFAALVVGKLLLVRKLCIL